MRRRYVSSADAEPESDASASAAASKRARRVAPPLGASLLRFGLFAALCAAAAVVVCRQYVAMPTPVARTASAEQFSEERARDHLVALSRIGRSWAGTRSNDEAAQFIEAQCLALQATAAALERDGAPRVRVDVQKTSGSMEFDILGGQ